MPHPKYLSNSNDYDLSIITIKGTITYSATVEWIPYNNIVRLLINFSFEKIRSIPISKEKTGGQVSCKATGWGGTGDYGQGPYPNDLQEIDLTTLSVDECGEIYGFVTPNNLCTFTEQGEGVCKYKIEGIEKLSIYHDIPLDLFRF